MARHEVLDKGCIAPADDKTAMKLDETFYEAIIETLHETPPRETSYPRLP